MFKPSSARTAGAAASRRLPQRTTVPCGSVSRMQVRAPSISPWTASERASIDLPPPPFCEIIDNTITFSPYHMILELSSAFWLLTAFGSLDSF